MPSLYLLDTNILVHLIRRDAIGLRIHRLYQPLLIEPHPILCVVSAGELRSLAYQLQWGKQKTEQARFLLNYFEIVSIDDPDILEAQTLVAPNANTVTPGNTDNRYPFLVSGGMRYQQVYAASQFSALSGPTLLTQIALRPSQFAHSAFTTTISDIQINLSTTSTAPDALSSTFASNTGADDTVVYARGSLTLSSSNTLGLFDTIINFTTPFLYNPAAGNLLLDVRNFSGAPIQNTYFDAQTTTGDSVSRVRGTEGSPLATSGTADTLGLITRFTYSTPDASVPEPGSVAMLLGFSVTGVGILRRRK